MNKKYPAICLMIAAGVLAGCQSSDQNSAPQPSSAAASSQASHSGHAAGEVVLQLKAEDPKILTAVGQRTANKELAGDKAGYLAFGPYTALDSGKYTLTVFGTLQTPAPQNAVTVDVTYEQSKQQAGKVIFDRATGVENGRPVLVKLDFELQHSVQDAEFRVLLAPGANVTMDGYTVIAD
jgi:hypothetical protein